jgi:hemerythrin
MAERPIDKTRTPRTVFAEQNMNLDDAVISHIVWKDKLLQYLLKGEERLDPAELSRDDRCPLGGWILSEGQQYADHSEYATLKTEHTRFHKAVGDVVRGAKLGLSIKPETVLGTDSEFGVASAAVVTAIVGLQRKIPRRGVLTAPVEAAATGEMRDTAIQSKRAREPRETVDWNPSYSVGVAQLDDDHQYLISLINVLLESLGNEQGHATAGVVLRELGEYAGKHFTAEERLMAQAGYPHLAQHRREHEIFKGRVAEMKQEFEANCGFDASKLLIFLRSWLLRHIQQIDKQYSSHLHAQGIR